MKLKLIVLFFSIFIAGNSFAQYKTIKCRKPVQNIFVQAGAGGCNAKSVTETYIPMPCITAGAGYMRSFLVPTQSGRKATFYWEVRSNCVAGYRTKDLSWCSEKEKIEKVSWNVQSGVVVRLINFDYFTDFSFACGASYEQSWQKSSYELLPKNLHEEKNSLAMYWRLEYRNMYINWQRGSLLVGVKYRLWTNKPGPK